MTVEANPHPRKLGNPASTKPVCPRDAKGRVTCSHPRCLKKHAADQAQGDPVPSTPVYAVNEFDGTQPGVRLFLDPFYCDAKGDFHLAPDIAQKIGERLIVAARAVRARIAAIEEGGAS